MHCTLYMEVHHMELTDINTPLRERDNCPHPLPCTQSTHLYRPHMLTAQKLQPVTHAEVVCLTDTHYIHYGGNPYHTDHIRVHSRPIIIFKQQTSQSLAIVVKSGYHLWDVLFASLPLSRVYVQCYSVFSVTLCWVFCPQVSLHSCLLQTVGLLFSPQFLSVSEPFFLLFFFLQHLPYFHLKTNGVVSW